MGEMSNAYSVLVGKLKEKTSFRKPRYQWEDNIRMDLREIVWEGVDWMHLVQDRAQWWALVGTVNEPSGSVKDGEFLD
jgi:hypothetical protein